MLWETYATLHQRIGRRDATTVPPYVTEREYQQRVLGRLDSMLRRSETEERYRMAEVVDLMFLLPETADADLEACHETYTFTGFRARFLTLLGCLDGRPVEALEPPSWVRRLYRVARLTHSEKKIRDLIFSLLASCQSIAHLRTAIEFIERYESLSLEERPHFLRLCYLRSREETAGPIFFRDEVFNAPEAHFSEAFSFEMLAQAHCDYPESTTTAGPRSRLARIPTGDEDTHLFRIAVPRLLEALEQYTTTPPPLHLREAVVALEWQQAKGCAQAQEPSQRVTQLGDDLSLLTRGSWYQKEAFGAPEAADEKVLKACQRLVEKVLGQPEPVRTIAVERVLAEADLLLWRVQFLVASVLPTRPEGTDHLRRLTRHDSLLVRSRALQGLMTINPGEIPDGYFETLDLLLADFDPARNRAATELLDKTLPYLPPQARTQALERLLPMLEYGEPHRNTKGRQEVLVGALRMIASHEKELPDGFKERLRRSDRTARSLTATVEVSEDWGLLGGEILPLLPFYLSLGGPIREALEVWTWGSLKPEENSRPIVLVTALSILGRLFRTPASGWDAPHRSLALRLVIGLLGYYPYVLPGRYETETVRMIAVTTLSEMLPSCTIEERQAVLGYLERNIKMAGDPPVTEALYLEAFATLLKVVPEWQTPAALSQLQWRLGTARTSHLQGLVQNLPSRAIPELVGFLLKYRLDTPSPVARFISHLIDTTKSPGEFQQVAAFFQDFSSLTPQLRSEFVKAILEDSERTKAGQSRGEVAPAGEQDPPILLATTKAQGRLRHFLIDRFVQVLPLSRAQKAALRADIASRGQLWHQGRLLPHLASLASFSSERGLGTIGQFVSNLIVPESVEAGGKRLRNPLRYRGMEAAFSPEFIGRWKNEETDRLIPMGEFGAPVEDSAVIRRQRYRHVSLQMAHHLGMPHASRIPAGELAAALGRHIEEMPLAAHAGGEEWGTMMRGLLGKMAALAEVSEFEVEQILQTLKHHPDLLSNLSKAGGEVATDLREFKRSLNATLLHGTGWLVITSNPADFVASGRDPVTCQDPTRSTGHNGDGQPVARADEGRFLYAKVVMAREARIEDGVATFSPEARVVSRTHLEATTATGQPDPTQRPHLLAERAYSDPGFIDTARFEAALDLFAGRDLGLNPREETHYEFSGRGMRSYPPPLADRRPVYRDTFRKPG